jgi:hypothetical protein
MFHKTIFFGGGVNFGKLVKASLTVEVIIIIIIIILKRVIRN